MSEWWLVAAMAAAAGYTDLRHHKIPNMINGTGFAAGILFHTVQSGLQGLLFSVLGAMLGFFTLLLLYWFRAVAAGDVKLFGAVGAISGPAIAMDALVCSLLFAGFFGLVVLLYRKALRAVWQKIVPVLFGFLYMKTAAPLFSLREEKDLIRFPFMWAVLPGLMTVFWGRLGGS